MNSLVLSRNNTPQTEQDKADALLKSRLAKLEGMICYGDLSTWTYSETLDPNRSKRNEYYAEEGGCNPSLTDRKLRAEFSDNCEVVLEFCPDKFHVGDRHDLEYHSNGADIPESLTVSDPQMEKDYHVYLVHNQDTENKETIAEGALARSLYWQAISRISKENRLILHR